MSKKFTKALNPDLKVRRTGFLGFGKSLEVSGGGLTYRVDRRGATAEQAAIVNSKIPGAVMRPPIH